MNKRMNKRVVDVTNKMHLEPVPGFLSSELSLGTRWSIKLKVKTNGKESTFQTKGKVASVMALSSRLKRSTEFHDGKIQNELFQGK